MHPEETRLAGPETAIRKYPSLLRRYARLLEVTSDLVSTLDLDNLLNNIARAAQELTGSEAASILLHDPQTNHLYFEATTGDVIETLGRTAIPAQNSLAGWIFTHQEPLIVDDALQDPRFFREVDILTQFHTMSVLGVPLVAKEKSLGVIEAVNKLDGKFDEEDTRVLQALAAQAAIAIQNTRLFQQSDLVAEMVHELRTPLGALTAAAHLLQRPDLPMEQLHKLGTTVYEEVHRLNSMASDFLELARLESGRARLSREVVHLGGLVGECLEIIRPQAESQGVSLDSEVDPSLAPVQGDRNLLKQLLLNLLTNAIKYNHPEGNVRVELEREADEVILRVIDTGKGIPREDLPRVFDRFYRVQDPEGRAPGTGLGLAIAKRIVESYRGSIQAESTLGSGSVFTVRLPMSSG